MRQQSLQFPARRRQASRAFVIEKSDVKCDRRPSDESRRCHTSGHRRDRNQIERSASECELRAASWLYTRLLVKREDEQTISLMQFQAVVTTLLARSRQIASHQSAG